MKNLLLIIDPQNDFCRPGGPNGQGQGALYVPGAEQDMSRLAAWLQKNQQKIDHIIITLDNHHLNDISHPSFWVDSQGQHPEPFSVIRAKDVEQGIWRSVFDNEKALFYLRNLERQGLVHTVWPPHCLIGSEGAAIFKPLFDAIVQWAGQGRYYQTVVKGTYPYTEHFGAFKAQVEFDDVPETKLNKQLLDQLDQYGQIFLAGEARSHCVGTSLKQIIDYKPEVVSKIVILQDAMSNVPGFEMESVYQQALEMGAKQLTTGQVVL